MYKITLNLPGLSKDDSVTIDGIGELKNGDTYEVSAEEAEAFRNAHMRPVESVDSSSGETRVENQPGPTLYEAFKDHEHITVETVTKRKKEGE